MAMRVNYGVEPIKSPPGTDRGGSRPKPPKAVAQRASLEAPRSVSDHQKPKRRLTHKTVAFAAVLITVRDSARRGETLRGTAIAGRPGRRLPEPRLGTAGGPDPGSATLMLAVAGDRIAHYPLNVSGDTIRMDAAAGT